MKKPRGFERMLLPQGLVCISDPYGTRTRVTAVKGRCPGPLDEGAMNCGNVLALRRVTNSATR